MAAARVAQSSLRAEVPAFTKEKEAISALQTDRWPEERFLIQSPYSEKEHQLDLESLDVENATLAKALCRLRATRDDYATAPYNESFNWPEVIDELKQLVKASGKAYKETSFYIVAFRSQIKPSTEYSHLGELDKAAHAEAVASGGFLKYWFGSPDANLHNLATCVWRSRPDAMEGGRGPAHRKAAGSTRAFFSIRVHADPLTSELDYNMADSLKDAPFQAVQVEALVIMKIAKHCSSAFPTTATGSIVGMDVKTVLEITNSFPFPTVETTSTDGHQADASTIAAAAPRQKANTAYQTDMIRHLKEVNVDANNVGWYTSATMGNFVNMSFIENQYHYQKENDKTVGLVYDASKSSQGNLTFRAFRLTPSFMAAYKEGKFTTEILKTTKLTFRDILVELPITVHNSHLLTSFLHQLPYPPSKEEIEEPNSIAELKQSIVQPPLYPSIDSLDVSIDPFLEKTCDLLLESIESHYTDLNNFQFYQRQLGREQAKITQWQTKRKAENALRAVAKQPLLPDDEWQRLFKLPQEPSRLEGMLNAKQVQQYSKQVDGFTANVTAKMFAVRENLLPQ
ncbi:eukaryotic translation initiation factor 3 subunit 3 [Drechmeria coniospora]|uniref:Eukaryotic translation initiation factor 3 subunit H n=1 Tax=Drechmeria coniospora TaxID=98403 RepID=A0A151GIL6_DRECN|nr:eukaryotic translation initiation factor 3 subunit 3 [Drechmeria coniospora]KYK56928.1 eukaryotic translation initiation factor 3 subunit 3 [Drechmeria coniospora]